MICPKKTSRFGSRTLMSTIQQPTFGMAIPSPCLEKVEMAYLSNSAPIKVAIKFGSFLLPKDN